MNHLEHPDSIDGIIKEVSAKDIHMLCREVMSITDTMDVLRAKWNVEILTAINLWADKVQGYSGSSEGHQRESALRPSQAVG